MSPVQSEPPPPAEIVLTAGSALGQFGGGSSPDMPPWSYNTLPHPAGRPPGERPNRLDGPGLKLTLPQHLAPPPTPAPETAAAATKTRARQPPGQSSSGAKRQPSIAHRS